MVAAVTTANAAAANTDAARTSLATNFDTFLVLLTAQLKNQDPLSPMDSTAFTQQLTQMTGVQQQLLTNDLLTSLLAGQNTGLGGASTYIGQDITAVWAADKLTDGKATWSYELGANATGAKLQVLDGAGKVVWTGDAPDKTAGTHDFTWDGKTTAGGQMSDGGVYTLKITASNASGSVASQVLMRGQVTGVEMYDGTPYLTVGNSIIPVSTVISLQKHAEAATPSLVDQTIDAVSSAASALNPLKLLS